MGEVVIRETFYLVKHAKKKKRADSGLRLTPRLNEQTMVQVVLLCRDEGGREKEGRKIKISRESSFKQHCFPALPHQPTPLIVNRPINHITL